RNRLRCPGVYAPAFADQGGVVVGPGGPRQVEEATTLGEGAGRIRLRVEEDVPVVERGDQADVLREQHSVAEHVTAHVADTGHGELLGLGIQAAFAEVPFHRFPAAAGGDAHRLVV